jgi:trehalose 6-phosphate synthase
MGKSHSESGRLIVVSNRGPYRFKAHARGVRAESTVGGLVSALDPLLRSTGGTWVAWDDTFHEKDLLGPRVRVPLDHPSYFFSRVHLTKEEIELYYHGFSNRALWPLCHYFLGRCDFEPREYECYREVNARFAKAARAETRAGDTLFIQDYHLALVPSLLRRMGTTGRIALFWHIPFPAWDTFRVLPWRSEIVEGMLGADLIGFHVRSYVHHFVTSAEMLFGAKWNEATETLEVGEHRVRVKACPLGIEFDEFDRLARHPDTVAKAQQIREAIGTPIVALGVDRMDYSKGIPERLHGIERFMERYPQYRRRFSFIQIAVPSRTEVPEYRKIGRAVDETVGRVNGRFAEAGWAPITYLCRSLPRRQLAAYYLAADIALITPLRDGLNLIAKEYAACKTQEDGSIILSEFAGAAEEMEDVFLVNPYNMDDVAEKIHRAAEIPTEERRMRMRRLRHLAATRDLTWWREEFLGEFLREGRSKRGNEDER